MKSRKALLYKASGDFWRDKLSMLFLGRGLPPPLVLAARF
jgi:hypothetical protein